jgi:hypothetical protein
MPKFSERESWLHWLTDLALGLGAAGIIAIEVLYGVPHPWLILIVAFLLMPLVGLHTLNLMTALSKTAVLTWMERVRFSIPVFFGWVAGVWIWLAAEPPSVAFFDACAQLIPVLVLVLAIEGRFFAGPRFRAPLVLVTVAVLGVAEFFSLRAIATERTSIDVFSFVGGALVVAFVSVTLLAILGPLDAPPQSTRPLKPNE